MCLCCALCVQAALEGRLQEAKAEAQRLLAELESVQEAMKSCQVGAAPV